MNKDRVWRFVVPVMMVLLVGVLPSCNRQAGQEQMVHCPMHPTYISDRPGDCPICGMRLVPIEREGGRAGSPAGMPGETRAGTPAGTNRGGTTAAGYVCPMHPEVTSESAGRCPKCGMDLVPVEREAGQGSHTSHGLPANGTAADSPGTKAPPGLAPVQVGDRGRGLAGIQTAAARREEMQVRIRTVGSVVPDETRIRHVHTKISGWIDKLFVNFTGQMIRKGDPVLAIYSPALLSSQEEYLRTRVAAARFAGSAIPEVRRGGEDLLAAARRRLQLFDVPEGFIRNLERTGKPQRAVTLVSPASGFVTAKAVFEGHQVEPGMELYVVTDLSQVWIEADFYEYESQTVQEGQEAEISLPYDPDRILRGRIAYIYPYLNPETRTLKVRFEVANPGLQLKPAMYADVLLTAVTGESIVIPDSAVMDSGMRRVVFVDRGGGLFEPREVRVGLRSGGRAQILAGLAAGEQVAVRANFLLDSESRLRAAMGAMGSGHESHAAGGAP